MHLHKPNSKHATTDLLNRYIVQRGKGRFLYLAVKPAALQPAGILSLNRYSAFVSIRRTLSIFHTCYCVGGSGGDRSSEQTSSLARAQHNITQLKREKRELHDR